MIVSDTVVLNDEGTAFVDLGYRPRKWQEEVHQRLKRFSVLVVHRRGGKTELSIATLVDAALRTKKQNARYAYVAPYRVQAKSVAWDTLKRYATKVPGTKVNEGELWIEFANGSRIRLFGADNADAMRGLYFDGVVIDEVADIKPEVWGEIIRPALADRLGWALFIGTPKGVNLFSELFFAAQSNPDWYAGLYTVDDTNVLAKSELELSRKSMSENQYRQEFLCDFSASVDNQLITIDQVLAACKKQIRESEIAHSPKIIGVDVARYGGDRSVIFKRQGLGAYDPIVFNGIDNMDLASRVAQEMVNWQPDAVFIDAGRGEGVIDRLRQLKFQVIPVDFGGKANSEFYENKRAEMWNTMKEWLVAGGCLPDMADLKTDLCGPTYTHANARGRFALESKDDLRKRGLRSSDLADALALTFAQPVAPSRGPGAQLRSSGFTRLITDHNPFADEDR